MHKSSLNKSSSLIMLALFCALAFSAAETRAQSEDAPKLEVGAQFTSATLTEPINLVIASRAGFGGRVTYNLTDSVALETQVDFFPAQTRSFFESYNGGRTTQAVFGVKAGKRFERFGIYGKARPGFVHFSRAVNGYDRQTFPPSTDPANPFPGGEFSIPRFGGRTEFATDIGGVIEFYPTRRIVTRFDAGDTIISYGARTREFQSYEGTPFTGVVRQFREGVTVTHNFQFSAGVGFRF